MRLHTLLLILSITVILTSTITEAKRRPPSRRKRPRPSGLSSLFNRGKSHRSPEPGGKESRVYYYSVPTTTTKPRIILGDSLNFSDLGIESPRPRKTQFRSPSSLSTLEQSYSYDDQENDIPPPPRHYNPRHRPRKQPKRPRGPGYRLERPWNEHYVLEQSHKIKSPHISPVPVMPYIRNAGKSLAGAYRAAIINSAKVAKFTGHTASRYFKGIRNLMSSKEDDRGRGDYHENRNDDTTPQDSNTNSIAEEHEVTGNANPNGPEIIEIDLTNSEGKDPSTLPQVYLDWGGSFWRFFYNKSSDVPHPENKP